MELIKQIKHAKQLNVSQLCTYYEQIQPYCLDLHEFMQSIYCDLMMYFSTYLRNVACYVHTMIHDKSKIWECEQHINTIRNHLELTMLDPIQHKLKNFIRYKSLDYIKMVTLYFMLNIPMSIHLYTEKIDRLHKLIDKQKR
jgi:hypothetical protein